MNTAKLILSLERFGVLLPSLVDGVTPEVARWKPPDGAWSILEIVCHLADEEEFDFRRRLESTLSDPQGAWPAIAPEAWALQRR